MLHLCMASVHWPLCYYALEIVCLLFAAPQAMSSQWSLWNNSCGRRLVIGIMALIAIFLKPGGGGMERHASEALRLCQRAGNVIFDHGRLMEVCMLGSQKVWLQLEEKQIPYTIEKINMRCYGDKPREYTAKVSLAQQLPDWLIGCGLSRTNRTNRCHPSNWFCQSNTTQSRTGGLAPECSMEPAIQFPSGIQLRHIMRQRFS